MKALLLILSLFLSGHAQAETVSPIAAQEITQLFSALQSSKCDFNRNGIWYNTQKATEHLHQKYDYLLKKGMITSAESFIDLAATKSSMSGKPYLVRCGSAAPVSSKSWFSIKLKELRSAGKNVLPKVTK